MLDDLELRIAKLALGPDDILVMRPGRILTSMSEVEIAARIGQRFGLAGRVMVIAPDMELSVVARSDAASEAPPDGAAIAPQSPTPASEPAPAGAGASRPRGGTRA
jgi:hypothetical protein